MKLYQKFSAFIAAIFFSFSAFAADANIDTLFDSVNLGGVNTKVMALALVILAIALSFKGITLVKRIIAKI